MDAASDPTIWQNVVLLVQTLITLLGQLAAVGFHWVLWILFAAVCLFGINWHKARHVLKVGGWAPAIFLILLTALVWSRIAPAACESCGLPNFWWQLGYVSMLAVLAMFCGWLQSVFHWTPRDFNFDPPAHGHGHGHDHDTGHGHSHAHESHHGHGHH